MHNGEAEYQVGPLPTHQEVTRDVLGRFQDLGSRYWGWVTVLAFLFVLGIVGFAIRLSEGFDDENRANWGYLAATLAFIVTTFTAMPVISAGLRLVKANWRRPMTRITENMAITGLLVVLMVIPAIIALPPID
jgi:amino acid permease